MMKSMSGNYLTIGLALRDIFCLLSCLLSSFFYERTWNSTGKQVLGFAIYLITIMFYLHGNFVGRLHVNDKNGSAHKPKFKQ